MLVRDLLRVRHVKGEVGIEIEVEGENLPRKINHWRTTTDGSLRGNGYEYVLTYPVAREDVDKVLGEVSYAYAKHESEVLDSNRTSVHIHINVQKMHMHQVFNYITLFSIFEPMLVHFCGEEREGNLFCLRGADAEWYYTVLEQLARMDYDIGGFRWEHMRYAALNIAALPKYGSLEFRSMRGTEDMQLISKWIEMLLALKDAALSFKTPINIIEEFSFFGPEALARKIFGVENSEVIFAYDDWEGVAINQMRDIQMMVYEGKWDRHAFIDEPDEDI